MVACGYSLPGNYDYLRLHILLDLCGKPTLPRVYTVACTCRNTCAPRARSIVRACASTLVASTSPC